MTPARTTPAASRFRTGPIAWAIGLLGLTALAMMTYAACGDSGIYPAPRVQVAVCIIYAIVFCSFMHPLQRRLGGALYHLAAPETTSNGEEESLVHEHKDSTRTFASVIALAVVIGSILMLLVFAFDFVGHASIPASAGDSPPQSNTNAAPSSVIKAFLAASGPRLGTFGDFFGGVVNPLLTFGTLVGLAITILLQRIQIREARAEASMSRRYAQTQAFETTFFNLLNLHAENIQNLTFDPALVPTQVSTILDSARMAGAGYVEPEEVEPIVHGRAVFGEILRCTARAATPRNSQLAIYQRLQREHNEVVGHYFRNLFQILNLVNSFAVEGTEEERYKTRKRYTNILRAQMSTHELAVLLLNCTYGTVDDGKFRNLLVWYKFFEHLPIHEENGALVVRDIARDIQSIVFEYFSREKKANYKWLSGAFGKHPVVMAFVNRQAPGWQPPSHGTAKVRASNG